MDKLQIVRNENSEFGSIRTIVIDNEPWFFASDVAKSLGYSKPNKAVWDHCKNAKKLNDYRLPQIGTPVIIDEFSKPI